MNKMYYNGQARRGLAVLLSLFILMAPAPILAENLSEDVPQTMQEYESQAAPEKAIGVASEDGFFTARLQPEILRPKGELPAFAIHARRFEQDFADKIIHNLMSGAELYPGREIEQRRLLKDIDRYIEEMKTRYAAANMDPNSSDYYQELVDLKAHGIPTFDASAIQKIGEDGSLQLAGKREDRFLYLGIEQQPENHYYRAFYRNAPIEQIPHQIFALPVTSFLEETRQLPPDPTREEVEGRTGLNLSGITEITTEPDLPPLDSQERFAQAVAHLRTKFASQEENYRDQCGDAPSFGPKEAAEKAEAFFRTIGIQNLALIRTDAEVFESILKSESDGLSQEEFMALAQTGKELQVQEGYEPVWHLEYQPAFAGVPFAYDLHAYNKQAFYMDEAVSAEKTPAEWTFCHIDIYLNDQGIVAFDEYAPMSAEKLEKDAPQLLPEKEILELAKEILPMKYTKENFPTQEQIDLQIQKMRLSYWREKDPEDPEGGRVIPVWNFYGSFNAIYTGQANNKMAILKDDPRMENSLLTLNAIDGTVVELARFMP